MTTAELASFQWFTITFAEHANAKILVLVCKTKEGAEAFYKALTTEGFKIDISKNNQTNRLGFHIAFTKGEVMGIPETWTIEQFPQLVWLTSGQLTHIITSYKDDQGKTQLLPHDYIFADQLLNMN